MVTSHSDQGNRMSRSAALTGFIATSLRELEGCSVVKDIRKAAVGVGVVMVVTGMALAGGAAALVTGK